MLVQGFNETNMLIRTSKSTNMKCRITLIALLFFLSNINNLNAQASGDYRSAVATGNWSNIGSWEMFNGSSWVAGVAYPQYNVGNAVTIQAGHNITVDLSQLYIKQTTVTATGTITVPTGITLWVYDGTGTDLTIGGDVSVTGSLKTHTTTPSAIVNSGGTITVNTGGSVQVASGGNVSVTGSILNTGTVTNAGTLAFNSGGIYQHNINGGTIPTATWNTGSTCSVTGVSAAVPSGLTQAFHHFTWNSPAMASNLSLGGGLTTVNGNLTFTSTGTGAIKLRLFTGSTGTLNVGGNLTVNGASAQPTVSGSSSATTVTLNIGGDIFMSAGTLYISDNNGTGATINAGGNFSMTGGTISASGVGRGIVNFNKTGTQIYSRSAGAITSIDMAVLSGSTLDMGTSTLGIASSLNFTLNAGASLQTASTTGVLGSITNAGTKTLSSSANYIFNGVSAQVTSAFVTTPTALTVNNLTINNAAGVTLSSALTANGIFTLTAGALTTGANDFTLGVTATASLEAGSILKITGGTTNFGARPVTLKSNSSGTASISTITGNNVTTGLLNATNVTTQVYIPGGRRTNRFLSHPFTGALTMASLIDNIYITGPAGNGFDFTTTGNPSSFWYNGAALPTPTWQAFASTSDASWTQYRGIRVLIRGNRYQPTSLTGGNPIPNADTLDMTGSLNLGVANIAVPTGYSVIGNPYPSPVDLGTKLSNTTNIGTQFWFWDANAGPTAGAYRTKIVGTPGTPIPASLSMNAAFVVNPTSATTINFVETDKTATDTAKLFRNNNAKSGLLELQVLYNDYPADNMFVRFSKSATINKDALDGEKLANPEVNFYALSAGNNKLSLDTRPFEESSIIPLGLTATKANSFKIKVADKGLEEEVYLKDKLLNTITKLEAGTEYAFDVTTEAASQGDNRFELMMKQAPTLPLLVSNFSVKLSPNPATDIVKVSFSNVETASTTITITNAEGKLVKTVDAGNVQSGQVSINVKGFAKGSYYVTLNNGTKKKTEKLQVQ